MTKTKTKKTAAKAKTTKKTPTKAPTKDTPVTTDAIASKLNKLFAETPLQIKRSGSKVQEKTATSRQSAPYPNMTLALPDKVALLRAYAYALETDTLRVSQAYSPTYAQRDYIPLLRDGDVLFVRVSDTATAPLAHGYSALTFGPGTDAKSAPASDDYDA